MSNIKVDMPVNASTDTTAQFERQRKSLGLEQASVRDAKAGASIDAQCEKSSTILYTDFVVGQDMGECALTYDEAFVKGWQQIFGKATSPRAQPAGVSLMLMMRAFLTIVSPRPPGNIHARQVLSFSSLPVLGDQITVSVVCNSKLIRKDRRYVELGVKAKNQREKQVFSGVLTLIWAD